MRTNLPPPKTHPSPAAVPYASSISTPLRWMFFLTLLAALFPLSIDVGVLRLYTLDLVLLPLSYVFFVVMLLGRKRSVPSWAFSEKLLFTMLVIMAVGAALSVHFTNSLDGFLIWFRCIIFYVMLRIALASNIIEIHHWSRWWSLYGMFLLIIGGIQVTTGSQFGLVENYFGANLAEQTYFLEAFRVSGTTSNSNIYGVWIAIFSLLINAKLLLLPKVRLRSYVLLALLLSIELWVLLATLSRGSLLTFLVAHAILLLMWIRFSRRASGIRIVTSALLLSIAAVISSFYYNRVSTLVYLVERLENNSDSERVAMLNYGLELLSYPKVLLIGTGMQSFFPTLLQYGFGTYEINTWQDFSDSTTGIHNIFVLLLVEGGIFVLLCFAVFYFSTVIRAYRIFIVKQSAQKTAYDPSVAYLLAITLALLVPMQLYNNVVTLSVLIFVLTVCAVINGLYSEVRSTSRRDRDTRRQVRRWT